LYNFLVHLRHPDDVNPEVQGSRSRRLLAVSNWIVAVGNSEVVKRSLARSKYAQERVKAQRVFLSIGISLEETVMGRGILLWLLGVPIPVIILLWLFFGH
jgi:hypothetical protein